MTDDGFRASGEALLHWIADYWDRIESFPVRSTVSPGEVRARLPDSPPEKGEPFDAVLRDVEEIILPGITHWQSPNFFAYYPANASGPAVLAELLSAGFGVQGMLWATSPACTELESHVLDWLAELLDLPSCFRSDGAGGAVIQDSASSATLCALLAARERATEGASNRIGVRQPLVAYTSDQAHSSVEKAVAIAGLGRENLRLVPCDDRFAMRVDRLARAVEEDRRAGLLPCFAVATLGTTSSAAVDPLPEIASVCEEAGIWLHVDGAYAGSAAVCPEHRSLQEGLGRADSYCVNPHKWLLTNFDCDAFYVRDRRSLIDALAITPEYLRNRESDSGAVIDYRDWQVPLGRRFRALKLWFVIRHYGAEGLRAHVRRHVAAARNFAEVVEASPEFELTAPPMLGLVCFRWRRDDDANRALLEALNASGALFLTHTVLAGRFSLRLAVGGTFTEAHHVEGAWERIRETAQRLSSEV